MESPGIATVETKSSKRPAKVLDHIRVSRSMDGGHVVEHHYTSYQHEPKVHKFGPGRKDDARAHLLRHTGLSAGGAGEAAVEDEAE